MKHLSIQIKGNAGTGKTTIAAIITKALEEAGIPVTVGGQESLEIMDFRRILGNADALGVRIESLKQNDVVASIETVQQPRLSASVPQTPYV